MATYYNKLDMVAAVSLLKGTAYKVSYDSEQFTEFKYTVTREDAVVYTTHSPAHLRAFCEGLAEVLNK